MGRATGRLYNDYECIKIKINWNFETSINLSGYSLCQLEALAMPDSASKLTAKKITHTPTEVKHLW